MRLVFNELYLFSTQEKEACKIKFDDGINVITSSQIDGTDRGKSVIMRSLYHALGADALFDDKWDAKNKVYILKFTINSTPYFIYRTADLFKMFDGNKMLLFSTISRHDLSSQLFPYTNFAVQLPSRNNQKLEITPPVFNYVLFFLDQDHYDGTKFTSFDRLGQYTNFKEYVLYYHLGAYDERYFELVRKKEQYVDEQNIAGKRAALLFEMQNDIEKKMGGSIFSGSIESLHAEMELCRTEYTNVLEKLNKSKEKILLLRNNQIESENAINELDLFSKQTEKELKILRGHRCPECNSFIQDTVSLQSKRYNLTEDVVSVRNMLQTALLEIANEIVKEEQKYTELLGEMRMYEERLKVNSGEIGDVLRLRGLGEIKDNLIIERQQLADTLAQINQALQDIKKKLRNYDDKKKSINEKYYSLLMSARTKFGLHDIKPDSFCSITKNFSAGEVINQLRR